MNKLWNRNFILVVLGMIISASGGVGLNIAMSVVVFQETNSTMLSALMLALSMIPQLVLPFIIGPMIDRRNPLKVLVTNEIILAFWFFLAAGLVWLVGFNYLLYLVFSLIISSFGIVSMLASSSVLPQIMAKSNYIRGNAVINVIYPVCSVVIAPVAMLLYESFGMAFILFAYAVACLLDAALESRIRAEFNYIKSAATTTLREYVGDLKSAFAFFKGDRAVRAVFLTFTLVMLTDSAISVLLYPFFEQSEHLTNNQYALMLSIRSAGYMVGGFLHYFIKIPDKWRFAIAVTVYLAFIFLTAPLFLMPYAVICAVLFFLGILGMNSANIRISAMQVHLPDQNRAKLNALYSAMTSLTTMLGNLVVGALGDVFPYWMILIAFQGFYLFAVLFFILPRKNGVRELYNYSTEGNGEG